MHLQTTCAAQFFAMVFLKLRSGERLFQSALDRGPDRHLKELNLDDLVTTFERNISNLRRKFCRDYAMSTRMLNYRSQTRAIGRDR